MDNQNHVTGNEQLEAEEQAIGEPLTQEDEDRLTQEKLRADADQEVEDLKELDASFGERE